ncbi:MAG: hypothetical protein JO189_04740 [Deltaproteobacteria bacterium]|nr:hypothetical protein [Deltaproteobacteria bacterium]
MGFEGWCRDTFGGTGRVWKTLAAALLIVMLTAATSRAGDVSGQPADNLSVTNSVSSLLPQGAPVAAPAPPPPGGEESWLSGLHISGYGSQTFGMWQNPTNLANYTPSRNNLAVARSLLQIDGNYRLNENNTFFARGWFVYEPPYSYNSANNPNYHDPAHASFGHMMNGYYNTYELRDAWWENKTGPLTTFVGNQIVVWGQSLAFRVGDVINPTNTCWAFGFANLEQSRVPQWMVHPILNLPEWGPFTSNFLEVVVQPGFQPNWQPTQYQDPYHKYRSALTAGRALPCLPAASHGPSARFDVQYPTEPIFGADFITSPTGPYSSNLYPHPANELVQNPSSREFWLCSSLNKNGQRGWNPYAAFLKGHPNGFNCNLGLSKNNNTISPIGDGTLVDIGFFQVPGMQPQNWNEGVRFHTLYGATEWTALYYYDSVNGGGPSTAKWTPFTNLWSYTYPAINEFGVTVDRPLPAPASIAEYFPAVFRGEMLYQNHTSVDTTEFQDMNSQRWSDIVKYMLAIDLDQAYAPWLTSTGNLSANLEMIQTTVMDNCKLCWDGNALDGALLKNDVNMLFNLGTSWWWSDFAPTWTMIWNPKGDTFALFPSIVLNPPWTKKYFMKLQAIEIMGGDKMQNIGLFKGQSYLLAQFQYNFNLM